MTAAMELMHRMLPAAEQYPLPPSEITAELTDEVGLRGNLKPGQHLALTLVNHFAYGAAAGSIYGMIAKQLPLPPIVKGIGFGLGVWSISYLGLLPALGILRPATEHPARRNVLMIVAHVVWGSVTGLVTQRLQ
jgi:putative membrane protein